MLGSGQCVTFNRDDVGWLSRLRRRGTSCRSLVSFKSAATCVHIHFEDVVCQPTDAVPIFTHPGPEEDRPAVRENYARRQQLAKIRQT